MANKEIVGWFSRGGKRIPIFKGEGKADTAKKERSETYQLASRKKDISGKTRDLDNKLNWRYGEDYMKGPVGKKKKRELRDKAIASEKPKDEYSKVSDFYARKHASDRARKDRKKKDTRSMSRVYQDLSDKYTKG